MVETLLATPWAKKILRLHQWVENEGTSITWVKPTKKIIVVYGSLTTFYLDVINICIIKGSMKSMFILNNGCIRTKNINIAYNVNHDTSLEGHQWHIPSYLLGQISTTKNYYTNTMFAWGKVKYCLIFYHT